MILKNKIRAIFTQISPTLKTKIAYRKSFGKKLNLSNPKTINEKILYLKLNDYKNNDLITKCVDKYEIRNYLTNLGYGKLLPKLYGVYDSPNDIDWDKLPSQYVVKCNHGCGYNILVPDSTKLNKSDTVRKLSKWLKEDYWKQGAEIQYKNVKKKIIIEEYLGDVKTYKFYCFNGIPKVMYISNNEWINNVCEEDKYIDFFDNNFNHIDCTLGEHPNYDKPIIKPQGFDEMLKLSEKLSKNFPFVRVDLYYVNEKIYMSELTFIPTAGFMHINPPEILDEWGTWLKL